MSRIFLSLTKSETPGDLERQRNRNGWLPLSLSFALFPACTLNSFDTMSRPDVGSFRPSELIRLNHGTTAPTDTSQTFSSGLSSSPAGADPTVSPPSEHLRKLQMRAISASIENSTNSCYASALNSYLAFIKIYDLPPSPTPDTLSLYIVFMCEHIKPQSVETYLTGICHELTPLFPDVVASRRSQLVTKTLKGCKKLKGVAVVR